MSHPDPWAVFTGLVHFTGPADPVVQVPRELAIALAEMAPQSAPPDQGTAPGGDFRVRDLAARYGKSVSWVRERLAGGDFGAPYKLGREQVARRAAVLAYEEQCRLSGEVSPSVVPAPQAGRGASSTSLTEMRRARSA